MCVLESMYVSDFLVCSCVREKVREAVMEFVYEAMLQCCSLYVRAC